MNCIEYKKGYKYQLKADYQVDIPIYPAQDISTDFIALNTQGKLSICNGYAWDGVSGPTPDFVSFMRSSLIHDALYQLMREALLDKSLHRQQADKLFYQLCLDDGLNRAAAWISFCLVRKFGDPSADPANRRKMRHAPISCTLKKLVCRTSESE